MGRSGKQTKLQVMAVGGAVAAAMLVGPPAQAGFFDFLFGGPDKGPHPSVSSYAEPSVTPPPLGQENVRQNAGSTGHGVAFCVRLCDGQHFPLEARVDECDAGRSLPVDVPGQQDQGVLRRRNR